MLDVPLSAAPAGLAEALASRGFDQLTPIQEAVLDPELAGRDLRICSQTGSGKTVAVGLILAPELTQLSPRPGNPRDPAAPRVLVVAPTRELAAQLGRELTWLYASLSARIAVVTGGTGLGGDFRALGQHPHVLIGTPGRLTDHLRRGSLDLGLATAVVLDEADEMLDMGFREDLELLLGSTPDERRTHMVSATFSRGMRQLASRYQRDAVHVEGSGGTAANDDIAHVAMIVPPQHRVGALVNLLLYDPTDRPLVFVRTRADAANVASELAASGFAARGLSGEMGQRERTMTLEAFRSGAVRCLTATDVASRGLDITGITRVIHFDLPETAELFTHRSGRTGRAGNTGTSILMVPPRARHRAQELFRRAKVDASWKPPPTPEEIRKRADQRLLAELASPDREAVEDARLRGLAEAVLGSEDPIGVVAGLLARGEHAGPCTPRTIPSPSSRDRAAAPAERPRGRAGSDRHSTSYVPFTVSTGARHGATPSRLLALVCRRGDVRGASIGAIRVGEFRSTVDVASDVAGRFVKAARRPDPRDPKITIRPASQRQA